MSYLKCSHYICINYVCQRFRDFSKNLVLTLYPPSSVEICVNLHQQVYFTESELFLVSQAIVVTEARISTSGIP
jgi:hypothetical protein